MSRTALDAAIIAAPFIITALIILLDGKRAEKRERK